MPWPGLQAYPLRHPQVDISAGFGESVQRLRYPSALWVCGYVHTNINTYVYMWLQVCNSPSSLLAANCSLGQHLFCELPEDKAVLLSVSNTPNPPGLSFPGWLLM